MIIEVTNEKLTDVNFFPATELEEIAQNVKTIITTMKGEVFLDRSFGVVTEMLDAPVNVIQAKLTARIADAVNRFEPRAKVTDVFYSGNTQDGEVIVTVRIKVVEKYLRGGVAIE